MTQEEKELLFKDLCARLPYRPIVHAKWSYIEADRTIKHNEADRKLEINDFYAIWDVRPYLRPMSSMTAEEREELKKLCGEDLSEFAEFLKSGQGLSRNRLYMFDKLRQLDFLNSHHFDYRGLIKEGLALDAPEGMYNIKEK